MDIFDHGSSMDTSDERIQIIAEKRRKVEQDRVEDERKRKAE